MTQIKSLYCHRKTLPCVCVCMCLCEHVFESAEQLLPALSVDLKRGNSQLGYQGYTKHWQPFNQAKRYL